MANHAAWKRKRYLDKLFHPFEQRLIEDSNCPSIRMWQLWSMKESAYKAHFRNNPARRFNPVKLRCFVTDQRVGIVSIEGCRYHTTSRVTFEYIHTTAIEFTELEHQVGSGIVCAINASPIRQQVIETLKTQFSESTKLPLDNLIFEKDVNRIPSLRYSGSSSWARPCSISHHGDFGAFSFAG